MSLRLFLEGNQPKDKGGPRNSNRTTFQLSWAFCKLIELHNSADDYVMILDYHDDIAVLDSPIDPKVIDFFQIKTKDPGMWTLPALTRSRITKKGRRLSIIGKMYQAKCTFPTHTRSLNLISNAKYNLPLKSGRSQDLPELCISDLEITAIQEVCDRLKAEHQCSTLLPYENITYLKVTDLSLRDHENHSLGRLVHLIESRGATFRIKLIQKMIADEIRLKTNYEWDIRGFDNIIKHKSIKRNFLDDIISRNAQYTDWNSKWTDVSNTLSTQGSHFSNNKLIKDKWNEYELLRMDSNNLIIQSLKKEIKEILKSHPTNQSAKLLDFVGEVKSKLKDSSKIADHLLTAAILMEYYE